MCIVGQSSRMRIIKHRGPFRAVEIFLEDVSISEIRNLQKQFQRISILVHRPLELSPVFRLRHKKTPNIHLEEGIEKVFFAFQRTVRNEIHKTERMENLEIRLPDHERESAFRAYQDFEFAQHRAPIQRSEFDQFILAGAYLDGRFISGITFFQTGSSIRVRSIFSLRLGLKELEDKELYRTIGNASKRLVYEICRYGISNGATIVDLASINLTDPAKKSIADFKGSFGAAIEDEYQYAWSSPIFRLMERCAAVAARVRARLRVR